MLEAVPRTAGCNDDTFTLRVPINDEAEVGRNGVKARGSAYAIRGQLRQKRFNQMLMHRGAFLKQHFVRAWQECGHPLVKMNVGAVSACKIELGRNTGLRTDETAAGFEIANLVVVNLELRVTRANCAGVENFVLNAVLPCGVNRV